MISGTSNGDEFLLNDLLQVASGSNMINGI